MADRLYEDGLRVESGVHSRIIVWRGRRAEREVIEGGRSALRNGWVALLRKELEARGRWPVADRPALCGRNFKRSMP